MIQIIHLAAILEPTIWPLSASLINLALSFPQGPTFQSSSSPQRHLAQFSQRHPFSTRSWWCKQLPLSLQCVLRLDLGLETDLSPTVSRPPWRTLQMRVSNQATVPEIYPEICPTT